MGYLCRSKDVGTRRTVVDAEEAAVLFAVIYGGFCRPEAFFLLGHEDAGKP